MSWIRKLINFIRKIFTGMWEKDVIKQLSETVNTQAQIIDRLTTPAPPDQQKVRLVLTTHNNSQSNFIIMAIQLNANQFSIDQLGLVDSDTGGAVAATFDSQVFASSDPTIFTTTPDPANPNQTKDVAVAAGSATLTASANATYTDSKTGQSVTKALTVNVPVTVIAVVAGENVELVIIQGVPQAQ